MAEKIRVAIVGGGMCGCSLANGLLQYPQLEFDVFESKSSFGERGAAVSLDVNTKNALKSMGLDPEKLLQEAGASQVDGTRCLIAVGEHKGKPIIDLPGGQYGVVRTRWLDQLLKSLPKDRLHANKKLKSISGGIDAPCTLTFEDGTSHVADVVLGCDGIHSTVRKVILEEQYPNLIAPLFGGYWDARGVTTPQKAAEQFGTELLNPLRPTKIALAGEGAIMIFRPTDDYTRYDVIVSAVAGPQYDQSSWKQELSREFVQEAYKDWEPKFRDAVIDSLFTEASGSGVVYSQWESPETPIYHRGNLCVIGDAAHAMLPWMGVGAEMATEDAAVMAALLGSIDSTSAIPAALMAYQQARHGRCEAIMKQNHVCAKAVTGQYGLDPAKIAPLKPETWWADIQSLDLDEHIRAAIANLNALRRG